MIRHILTESPWLLCRGKKKKRRLGYLQVLLSQCSPMNGRWLTEQAKLKHTEMRYNAERSCEVKFQPLSLETWLQDSYGLSALGTFAAHLVWAL